MEFVTHVIPWKPVYGTIANPPDRPIISLLGLGDLQYEGKKQKNMSRDLLRATIKKAKEINAKLLGMGDMRDIASPSNRQKIKASGLYDSVHKGLDQLAYQQTEELYYDFFEDTKGMWLGMLQGHHYHVYSDGDYAGKTSDQHLADLLDCPFLGDCAEVNLKFVDKGKLYGRVKIWCHHGYGSGKATGAVVRKLEEKAAIHAADIFMMGHLPKLESAKKDRTYSVEHKGVYKLRHIPQALVCTGGYAKSYTEYSTVDGRPGGGYAEKAGMNPAVLGSPFVYIAPYIVDTKVGGVRNKYFFPDITIEV